MSNIKKTLLDPSQLMMPTLEDMDGKKMLQDVLEMMAQNRDKVAKLMACIGNYFKNFHILIIRQCFQLFLWCHLYKLTMLKLKVGVVW